MVAIASLGGDKDMVRSGVRGEWEQWPPFCICGCAGETVPFLVPVQYCRQVFVARFFRHIPAEALNHGAKS